MKEQNDIIIAPKEKKEARSKRVNLLIQPSVYDKAQQKCDQLGISINECVNQFLIKWVDE
jgi:predicted HicB family RNase H-like nuclease